MSFNELFSSQQHGNGHPVALDTPPADTVAPGESWHLYGRIRDEEPSRKMLLQSFPFTIGRREDLRMTLDFPTVSGLHAEIRLENNRLVLHDLQSTNGTFVNGTKVDSPVILKQGDLVQFANIAFRVGRQSTDCRKTVAQDVIGEVLGLVQFEKLLDGIALTPHFQPIIRYCDDGIIGFESLARSNMEGLETPATMFKAAKQLQLESELSRILRRRSLETGLAILQGRQVFLNTHPAEMYDPHFLASLKTLRREFPVQPIELEIHELAVTDVTRMKELREELRTLNIGLAYDDFGAGQARLLELIEVQPDYLKFDRSLLKNIHTAPPAQQDAVAALVRMTTQLGVVPLAEGIECREEDQVCRQLGFELGQGYFYGRPAPPETFIGR